jgi:4,5:9,10-diseco-3-hydroxy-5,9,17-trioxoandrosta-1(10),2-diene-4-oate hydrolase
MPTQTSEVQYSKIGQVNTRFWKLGKEGSTVLLIHGIGGSLEDWILNADALAKNHRVYALDLVGYGHSDKPSASYSFSYMAQFVKDFMEEESIDSACLIGHSLGGGISLQFSIQFPSKVEKLVLVGSAGLGQQVTLLLRVLTLPIIGKLLARPSRKGTANFLKECLHDPALVTDELVDFGYSLASLPGAQDALLSTVRTLGNIRGMRKDVLRPIADNLSAITVPTLIFWGQQDRILPVAHAQVAKDKIPDTQLEIFDPCGHFPQLERPEEFNSIVLKFLAG